MTKQIKQTEGQRMSDLLKPFFDTSKYPDKIADVLSQAIDLRIDKRDEAIEILMTFILQGYVKFGDKYYYCDREGNITKEFVNKVIEKTYTY